MKFILLKKSDGLGIIINIKEIESIDIQGSEDRPTIWLKTRTGNNYSLDENLTKLVETLVAG